MKHTCKNTPCTKCKSWDLYRNFPFYKNFCEDITVEEMLYTEIETISFIDFMQALVSPISRELKDDLVFHFPEYVEMIEKGE